MLPYGYRFGIERQLLLAIMDGVYTGAQRGLGLVFELF
jgi:hypothetical protein